MLTKVVNLRETDQCTPAASSLPCERPDVLDDHSQAHPVLEVYWITPQHVIMDVMELSDCSSTFSSICTQHGMRTGERLYLKEQFSQPSYYVDNSGTQLSEVFQYSCTLNLPWWQTFQHQIDDRWHFLPRSSSLSVDKWQTLRPPSYCGQHDVGYSTGSLVEQ